MDKFKEWLEKLWNTPNINELETAINIIDKARRRYEELHPTTKKLSEIIKQLEQLENDSYHKIDLFTYEEEIYIRVLEDDKPYEICRIYKNKINYINNTTMYIFRKNDNNPYKFIYDYYAYETEIIIDEVKE
jgi:uncharacterized membrane protein YgaE (UPF0421/DUF939 family)